MDLITLQKTLTEAAVLAAIGASLITAIAALGGIWLTNWLNESRAIKLKLNDLRRNAYSLILSDLAQANRISDFAIIQITDDVHGYHASDMYRSNQKKIFEHFDKAQKIFQEEYLNLSDKFIKNFEDLYSKVYGREEEDFPDDHFSFNNVINEFRPKLMKQARREISKP